MDFNNNNGNNVTIETQTVSVFAQARGISEKSAKRLLARASVPIVNINGVGIINPINASKLIENYMSQRHEHLSAGARRGAVTRSKNLALKIAKNSLEEFIELSSADEASIILAISSDEHSTLESFFAAYVKNKGAPKHFFKLFEKLCIDSGFLSKSPSTPTSEKHL